MSPINLHTPRERIIEILNQFVLALDDGNGQLLASILTDDMQMDLSGFQKLGIQLDHFVLDGRDVVVPGLMKNVGKTADTMHHLSNFLVTFTSESEANISYYTWGQHFRLGEGAPSEYQDFFSAGNRCQSHVVKTGANGSWLIKRIVVDPGWTLGKPDVMKH